MKLVLTSIASVSIVSEPLLNVRRLAFDSRSLGSNRFQCLLNDLGDGRDWMILEPQLVLLRHSLRTGRIQYSFEYG
jgi:hypothetical protein